MLDKKQYMIVIISASLIFIAIFMFSYIYTVTNIEPIVPEEQQVQKEKEELGGGEIAEVGKDTSPITILPSTNVVMRIVDQYDTLVSEQLVESKSLLGYDEKTVSQMFRGYEVTKFDHKEVILEKVQYIEPKPKTYKLGIEQGQIGIVTLGDQPLFSTLGISNKEFSKQTNMMIINGLVNITASQKDTLEQDPDYIEYILQNFSE